MDFQENSCTKNQKKLQENMISKKRWHTGAIIFLLWCLFGFFSFQPLKWSDAFKLNDNFKSYLALNPLQNFFTTLQISQTRVLKKQSEEIFSGHCDFLQLDKNIADEEYSRDVLPGSKSLESRPNIVLVICESFSMYKSSMSGNPLNSTPFFNQMSERVFFSTVVLALLSAQPVVCLQA